MLVATVITAVVKDIVGAAIIFSAVRVNAIIGFIQEPRAERAIKAAEDSAGRARHRRSAWHVATLVLGLCHAFVRAAGLRYNGVNFWRNPAQ